MARGRRRRYRRPSGLPAQTPGPAHRILAVEVVLVAVEVFLIVKVAVEVVLVQVVLVEVLVVEGAVEVVLVVVVVVVVVVGVLVSCRSSVAKSAYAA